MYGSCYLGTRHSCSQYKVTYRYFYQDKEMRKIKYVLFMTSHFIRGIYANEIEIKVNHINVVIKMAFKTAYEQYADHNSAADMIEIYIV